MRDRHAELEHINGSINASRELLGLRMKAKAEKVIDLRPDSWNVYDNRAFEEAAKACFFARSQYSSLLSRAQYVQSNMDGLVYFALQGDGGAKHIWYPTHPTNLYELLVMFIENVWSVAVLVHLLGRQLAYLTTLQALGAIRAAMARIEYEYLHRKFIELEKLERSQSFLLPEA